MKHYSYEEWQELIADGVNEETKIKMLEHTMECQSCLDIYLSLIDEGLKDENTIPSPDFSSKVINKITVENKQTELLKRKKHFTNIMIYYTSAACITLFLISHGCFDAFLGFTEKGSKAIANQSKATSFVFNGWTDTLTKKTSSFLNNINLSNIQKK